MNGLVPRQVGVLTVLYGGIKKRYCTMRSCGHPVGLAGSRRVLARESTGADASRHTSWRWHWAGA